MMQPRLKSSHKPEDFKLEGVKNYYEHLVSTGLAPFRNELSTDQIADATCIALNRLPAWYIRNDVDAQFYLHDVQIADVERKVSMAIDYAIARVTEFPR